jgi:hypothetical protein
MLIICLLYTVRLLQTVCSSVGHNYPNRYESEILDAGDTCSVRVTAHDDPPYSYVGPSPTHAWQQAIEAVNDVSQTRRRCAVSPNITQLKLIQ